MTDTNWHDKPLKDETRDMALEGYKQRAAAIFLPGVSPDGIAGLDIRKGIEIGALTGDLPIYGVERDPDRARAIKRDMTEFGLGDFRMHQGNLDFLDVAEPVDFAFIDLMGTLEPEVMVWLRDTLSPNLTEDAHFSMTMAECPRGSIFMKQARIVYETHFPDVVAFAAEHYNLPEMERLLPVLLLRGAFHRYNFALVERDRYQNSKQGLYMLFYKLRDFSPIENNTWPSLATVMDLCKTITIERATHEVPGTSDTDTKNWRNRPNANPTTPEEIAENTAFFNSAWEIRERLEAKHNLVLDYLITEQAWGVIVPASRTVLFPLYQTLDAVTAAFGLNIVTGD